MVGTSLLRERMATSVYQRRMKEGEHLCFESGGEKGSHLCLLLRVATSASHGREWPPLSLLRKREKECHLRPLLKKELEGLLSLSLSGEVIEGVPFCLLREGERWVGTSAPLNGVGGGERGRRSRRMATLSLFGERQNGGYLSLKKEDGHFFLS